MDVGYIWIPATLIAASAQVARNAMQRRLTERIGVVGATQVRFLFGLPFACLFLAIVVTTSGDTLPAVDAAFVGFLVVGAAAQVLATALMLAAMRSRSFGVVTALVKTEPVQVAVFGFAVLGDRLTPVGLGAILVATLGVMVISWAPRLTSQLAGNGGGRSVALGLASGAFFAVSAVGFRGAILSLDGGGFLVRASTTLVAGLALQSAILAGWSAMFDRPALTGSVREWRSSLAAGFVGATASQFWFIGFALTATANVRTLGLVEVILAQIVSGRVLGQAQGRRDLVGTALVLAGILALLWASR